MRYLCNADRRYRCGSYCTCLRWRWQQGGKSLWPVSYTHLIRRGGFEMVKITADFYHMAIEEDDISRSLTEFRDVIGHIHIAENHRYQPGTGSIDWNRHMPVSYTHLDVYKRQIFWSCTQRQGQNLYGWMPLGLCGNSLEQPVCICRKHMSLSNSWRMCCRNTPVSYTHLAVFIIHTKIVLKTQNRRL